MADARIPPSGPPPRDPTAPARLLDAAAEIGLRVGRTLEHGLLALQDLQAHVRTAEITAHHQQVTILRAVAVGDLVLFDGTDGSDGDDQSAA